ncbi:MAG: hypothetical protein HQK59_04435 [Deltaproteobacteria bacterium]|nr:hypothetical protein [Deltaproteobacteria bacterium]
MKTPINHGLKGASPNVWCSLRMFRPGRFHARLLPRFSFDIRRSVTTGYSAQNTRFGAQIQQINFGKMQGYFDEENISTSSIIDEV